MNQSTECLDEARIDSLLQGNLAPHECRLVQEHLENCEQCRNRVESTIGSQQWWDDIASSLSDGSVSLEAGTHRNFDESRLGDVNDPIASLGETRLREKRLDLLGPTDDPDMLGRIGSYEIVGLLGQGGMGVVFKGFDRSLNRFVAIKMLLPHLAASGAARKRFAREAQAVAAVVDDHVMAIHCVDQWQGVPYLVMTYARGITLQKRLSDNGPLEVREILRIGMQAAKGLAAAHAQGIVHRDIKPANIFLDQNVERVQLMDFGLARAVDDASLTRTGVLAGTPQYMSPEQARAEAVDHRSDLFSLGSVMYAMCTGHAPFRAESSYSVLRLITDKEPRPIREINPDVPDWLCSIIAKLMAKQAGDRFTSADQVAELFQVCLAHLQSPTTTALPAEFAKVMPERSVSMFQQPLMGVFVMCCLSLLAIPLVIQNVDPTTQTGPSKLETSSQPSQSGNPLQVGVSDVGQPSEDLQSIADDSILLVSIDSVLPSDKGHPFIVKNSSIVLPSLDRPIVVSGRSISEIESAISEAYLQQLKIQTKARIREVTSRTKVINVNQKSPSGIWKTKQIISAGQVIPPDKAPSEFVFRRNQMIWKFTGKTKVDDRVFDVELDVTKSPKWITLRSRDPKRSQPVLGLFDSQGNELRIFTQRDAQGQPSTERPAAIGTGDELGTDLMILELKSLSVDEMRTYSIDEYVSKSVAQWKESNSDAEPSEEAIQAKTAEIGNKLAEEIDGRFGSCNVIEFDANSKTLLIDHTEQAHRKIEAFLKESIPVSTTQAASDSVGDSVLVARTEFDVTNGIEAAQRLEQQAQEIANLPRFYLYSNLVSGWLDGIGDEAERSEANFEKAMNERLKPDTPSSTRITAWDEKRFLFGYDKPNLDGAKGNTRIVNHYFSHEDSIWQRQKTNKDAPQYTKLELPYVWKKVDANAFFHLRSARLEFPWGNTDGNIKFALVPLEFAEYQVVGEETVDGTKCWVVMSKPRRCKLWFDQKSGRLLQMLRYVMQGVESTPFHETPEVEKLCGRKFDTLDAFHDFGKATDRATFQRLAGLYGSLYFDELAHPIELTRFSDYREIAPGIWFPHQATDVFAGHSPSDNNKFRFSRGELRVITLETGRSLEETIAAFVSEMSK